MNGNKTLSRKIGWTREKLPQRCHRSRYQTLRRAIPAHCFERSLFISSLYLLVDLTAVTVMFLVAYYVFNSQIPWYLQVLFWPAYWACQGTVSFGVWIIAHECGHRSFCESKSICDAVGLVLHSALMVPYHSWRISHAKHHTNTNRMDGDEAFVPCTRKQLMEEGNLEYPNLFYRFLKVFRYLTVGLAPYIYFCTRAAAIMAGVSRILTRFPRSSRIKISGMLS